MATSFLSADEQAALAARIRAGESAAEDQFARLFRRRIFLMILMRTQDREAASDLVQEVLMAALLALRGGRLREGERLAAFVCGTTRNLVNNYLRSRSRRPAEEPISPELARFDGVEDAERSERMRLVAQALERLDVGFRQILSMSLADGLKPGEIARQLHLTPEVVRTRKSRAVRQIIEGIRKMSRK